MEVIRDKQQIENIAANLRAAMIAQNMRQEQLEARSGVTQSMISRILNAKTEPGVTTVWRIARVLKLSVDALLATPDEDPPPRVRRPREIFAKSA